MLLNPDPCLGPQGCKVHVSVGHTFGALLGAQAWDHRAARPTRLLWKEQVQAHKCTKELSNLCYQEKPLLSFDYLRLSD